MSFVHRAGGLGNEKKKCLWCVLLFGSPDIHFLSSGRLSLAVTIYYQRNVHVSGSKCEGLLKESGA